MGSLRVARACIYIGFFAFLASGCTTDGDSLAAPTPAVSTTTTTTTTVPPTSVPVIANMTASFSSNTCVRAADGLTNMALVVGFDYTDGSGDLSGGKVVVNR